MTAHGPQFPTHVNPHTGATHVAYCPGRDFINLYPLMLHQLARHFDNGRYDEEIQRLSFIVGCSFDEAGALVAEVMRVQTEFIRISCENPEEKFMDVLSRAGWYTTSVPARAVLLAAMGELVQGQIFAGIRDVALAGESPPTHWQLVLTQYWDVSRRVLPARDERSSAAQLIAEGVRRLLVLDPRACYAAITQAVRQDTGGKLSLWELFTAVWRGCRDRIEKID